MLDLGISLALATLFATRGANASRRVAAVRKLGQAGQRAAARADDEHERAEKLAAAVARGNEKLESLRAALAAERRAHGGSVPDEVRRLARDLRTELPKLGDVLHDAVGLVRDETGRWRIVHKRTAPAKPSTPAKPTHRAKPSTPAKPPPEHKPKPHREPRRPASQAARDLRDFLGTPGSNWGWQGMPSPFVKLAQHDMGGGLVPDGRMGPKTRARARALGVELPYAQRKPTSKPVPKPAPKPAAPRQKPPATTGRSPARAARDLRTFMNRPGSNWGFRGGLASPFVKLAQHDMGGGLIVDGRVGPKTRARARALGVELPTKPAGTSTPTTAPASTTRAASPRSPAEAAQALRDYLSKRGANWGWGGPSSPMVYGYQSEMGELTPDGRMGPKTRARARALGVMLPSGPVK